MITSDLIKRLYQRGIDIPGSSGKVDLHHAIITKGDSMKLPPEERRKIDDERNILVIDHDIHLAQPPSREKAIRLLRLHYTYNELREWFYSFHWRGKQPFIFPAEDEL